MSNDQRKRHALEILGIREELTPENEATILSMLEEIDTVGDGYFSERDVCQYFTGTIDFMCGEKDHYVPNTTTPPTPPTPPTNTEPKQAETFNDIWSLVLSLDDGELTKADLLNLIDYVMPDATREEINYEFNLHDIDHDGVVDRNEGYHVHHTEDLRMTIQKA
jgi:Ca2+-binding EF-hand superfamily protein